jgi:hypothetical protein
MEQDLGTKAGDELEDEGDPNPASAQAPKIEVTQDIDFISNQAGGAINPRFSRNQNENAWYNFCVVLYHCKKNLLLE